ncbi:hypothetical protein NUW58_g5305 [Xylaria curta]|uniref:Uncharacterized protein n=1 Tax=Xylaria curta TaxID=42375 RepID=A0ACC1P3H7_9PEZI|nr:hypothetical protein NUW58_g5305 [Xylaria curta]
MPADGVSIFLHLLPIMSSTSSLWYAWDQYEQMTLFRTPELKSLSNQLLPKYFTSFFNRGAPRVIGLLTITASSCGAILRYSSAARMQEKGAFPWYIAGLSLAISHLAWAPAVFPSVKAIEKDAKEKNVAQLETWLRLHVWRSLTVDIGAWICCIVATVKFLS